MPQTQPPAPPKSAPPQGAHVAIVMSTFDGEAYLPAQLESFLAQQNVDWTLYWRDDGSTDQTIPLMQAFTQSVGPTRCIRIDEAGHLGITPSYMALLRHVAKTAPSSVAFSDQDDVWLPQKLARGLTQLAPHQGPALYCSRQLLVDAALTPLGPSAPIRIPPGLGPALTQNIATGCTVILNPAAAALVAGSTPPPSTLHDWWSYLVVAATGGRILADPEPTVLYRQHGHNAVGAPQSKRRRALAALRRSPNAFMNLLRAHVEALRQQPDLLSPHARTTLHAVAEAIAAGPTHRLQTLRRHGLLRQTRAETWLFRYWFLIG